MGRGGNQQLIKITPVAEKQQQLTNQQLPNQLFLNQVNELLTGILSDQQMQTVIPENIKITRCRNFIIQVQDKIEIIEDMLNPIFVNSSESIQKTSRQPSTTKILIKYL